MPAMPSSHLAKPRATHTKDTMNHPHPLQKQRRHHALHGPATAAFSLALASLFSSVAGAAPIGVYTSYFVTGSAGAWAPGDGRGAGYQ